MTDTVSDASMPGLGDAPIESVRGEYRISTDRARIDVAAVHAFLSQTYWSPAVPEDVIRRGIAGAICFGIYHGHEQVGFARVITDRATYAYLSDVYVLEAHRGRGLAKWMMEVIMAHPDASGTCGDFRFRLATRTVLYTQFGFEIVATRTAKWRSAARHLRPRGRQLSRVMYRHIAVVAAFIPLVGCGSRSEPARDSTVEAAPAAAIAFTPPDSTALRTGSNALGEFLDASRQGSTTRDRLAQLTACPGGATTRRKVRCCATYELLPPTSRADTVVARAVVTTVAEHGCRSPAPWLLHRAHAPAPRHPRVGRASLGVG